MSAFYRRATYAISAHNLSQLPKDEGFEVAFAGRSNAGKSSAINTICDQKSLARTSKTPGRTRQINFFTLDEQRSLVDLPGYGFAKVSKNMKNQWQQTLSSYLQQRQSLRGLILVMDIRHPLKDYDRHMVEWCGAAELPLHILLTKADKLSRGKAASTLQTVRNELKKQQNGDFSAQLFSALKRNGIEEAHACLDKWFALDEMPAG